MKPLTELAPRTAGAVRAVFTDIDDTLTTDGRLTPEAFAAMWKLHDAGIAVVPVTGRPAGWCDHIARMWPVQGVVGENGAFYFRYDTGSRQFVRRFLLPDEQRRKLRQRLARLGERILDAVPGAAIASDQDYRIHDLAVDYCEDVDPLGADQVDAIVEHFARAGATAKVSSIHVNGWFGTWDKLSMIERFAGEVLGLNLKTPAGNRRAVYVGDSPNDEPAFAYFRLGVGVANIRDFTDRLVHPPAYVTRAKGGRGFAEVARKIIRSRKAKKP